ncbi:MAG: tRNA pseudouridine(55) synthase TruB [Candidatus Dadabacteria bacterium]|nr:MAG: tRNA pseudouridine(55) synthase TruB [Candidatus Dadabacteria bacterium]
MKAGLLLVDKPAGMSSAAALTVVKKKLAPGKIGHAGTLDPFATGLLVCLTGEATRLAKFASSGKKAYSGTIKFGVVTDSDDITGKVLKTTGKLPNFADIARAAKAFSGSFQQVPPKISAVKVAGQRAYKLARRGQNFELKSRKVSVYSFDLSPVSEATVFFRISCSAGTYIRSIARDLGELLGCGGCLESLRREECEPFSVDEAVSLEELSKEHLRSWEDLFPDIDKIEVSEKVALRLLNGDIRVLQSLKEFTASDRFIYKAPGSGPLGIISREKSKWAYDFNMAFDSVKADIIGA